MRAIYDFDKTLFDGDSTERFVLFLLKRHKALALRAPRVAWAFLKMALGAISKTQAKQALYQAIFPRVADLDAALSDFWQRDFPRVKGWYIRQKQPSDLVISASPEFLLRPACDRLGVKLIASRVDPRTGLYEGENCHGEEKVRRYRASGLSGAPFCFYSDSLSDAPMARLAQEAHLVTGDRITPWPPASA
ncbi:MAG: haloacid dehalogenase-like hydrolase [Clostridia bacterium]